MDLTMRIISFFRCFARRDEGKEVLVNVYWDKQNKEFVIDTPEQIVSKTSVYGTENPDYLHERYIHYMDIHSHNSMKAFFSSIDDKYEKATRLYTVIGRLDRYFPEIKTRISNGGKYHEIDPEEVFDYIDLPFPKEWKDRVNFRVPHKDVPYENVNKKGALCVTDNLPWDTGKGDLCVTDNPLRDTCEGDVPWYTDGNEAPHKTGGGFI
jgi:hypothetical protein